MRLPSLKLNTGALIPQIGFGLWRNTNEQECIGSVKHALKAGYRHFDDAQVYDNEEYLGEALQQSDIPRQELFITTKIARSKMGMVDTIPSFEESLEKLKMDYVDLLLLHFPQTEVRDAAWIKLQELYKDGRAKAIGVSNYTIRHLEEMKKYEIWPAVNQVEMSVGLQQEELVNYCKSEGIVVEAYTPLAEGLLFDEPILKKIAQKYGKTVPQVMLRWCIDYGVVVLTKSATPKRIEENINIFDFQLDGGDMKEIKKLDRELRVNWNPTNVP